MSNYQRVKIKGVIECKSDMAIASGQIESKKVKPRNKPETEQNYAEICLTGDEEPKPYIPASSLRGLLRDLQGFKTLEGLFATETGVLRFYDAVWHCENPDYQKQQIHTRNKINPRTGTAQDKHLYSHAYVSAGSLFNCEIEADGIGEEQLKNLLGLLNCLNADPLSQLGKHQSKQQGLIKWQTEKIEVLDDAKLIDWLINDKALEFTDVTNKFTASLLPNFQSQLSCFVCTFTPQSPILVNDPNRFKEAKEEPVVEFYRDAENKLMIPSSSLIGVIRGQCRKILLTLLMAQANAEFKTAEQKAEEFLNQLFGSTGQRSRIWLTDAIATNTAPYLQMFTAIDRFTGGVKEGALYKANAATATTITATLYLDKTKRILPNQKTKQTLTKAQRGLLVLLLRDAMEGDLKVGWGKSKGYGVLQLSSIKHNQEITECVQLLKQQETLKLQTYLDALYQELGV